MKKFTHLVIVFVLTALFVSCEDSNQIKVSAETTITKKITVVIPKTNGTPVALAESATINPSQEITNFANISDITINEVSYEISNPNGNPNAVVQTGTLKINGGLIGTIINANITQVANSPLSKVVVTNATLLNMTKSLLLSSNPVNFNLDGTALSDAGQLSFDLSLTIKLTATLK